MPPAYEAFLYTAVEFPDPEAVRDLREMGFRYLLLERSRFNGWRAPEWPEVAAALERSDALRVVDEMGGFVVVEFRGAGALAPPEGAAGAAWVCR
jgi:hypothetical protein